MLGQVFGLLVAEDAGGGMGAILPLLKDVMNGRERPAFWLDATLPNGHAHAEIKARAEKHDIFCLLGCAWT